MFTQPCFIRDNNAKLFNTLHDLGYKHQMCFIKPYRDLLVVNNGYYSINFPYGCNNEGFIDCGTNEDLFLAIAALRDDTDKYQWFVYEYDDNWKDVGDYAKKGYFVLCTTDKYYCGTDVRSAHKATVEELIEHFKDK